MDTLPEECLLHLISFIALHSLHALLLTNKTFFRLVTPILYSNPLANITPFRDQPLRQAKILHLLLSCIPHTLQHLPYYHSTTIPLPIPSIDYLSLYTLHSEKLLQNINLLAIRPSPKLPFKFPPNHHLNLPLLHAKIHAGLINHTPQHIHTIAFSTHNISLLQPLALQLTALVRLELSKRPNNPDLSAAHTFITLHRHHFSTLKEIKILVLNTADKSDLTILIQAMKEPHIVDVSSWANAEQYLTQFPLQQCRVLLMGLRASPSIPCLDPAILAQCSHLQTLRMCAFHQDIFSWAFTRRHPHIAATNDNSGETLQLQTRAAQLYAINPKLVSVNLYGVDRTLIPALVDACDAFRETLQRLAGISSFIDPSVSHLSWDWQMPCLTHLDLEGTLAVNFDLESLKFCPLLQDLRLAIGRNIPPDWNVLHKASQLTKVSCQLRHLRLDGWWDLPDAALTQTLFPVLKRLQTLDLMWCRGPTYPCYLDLMARLPSLSWLGVSATAIERDGIIARKDSLGLRMEIDIYV